VCEKAKKPLLAGLNSGKQTNNPDFYFQLSSEFPCGGKIQRYPRCHLKIRLLRLSDLLILSVYVPYISIT